MIKCTLCPNGCKIDKNIQKGLCGTDNKIRIAKFYLHKFEEPIISGNNGSGTIFFTGCSLKCVFCQNYELSRNTRGKYITTKELVDVFKQLEDMGAHNINLVNPTHFSNGIMDALNIYKPSIPIVYNTHGYENTNTVAKLFDYVDVFMPDLKFFSPQISARYTGKKDYFKIACKAIKIMANKPFVLGNDGLLKSGCLVRHLVLPQNTFDSKKILEWYANIKDKACINIMSQYTPFGEIETYPELQRKITKREYQTVIDYAISLGIDKAFYQKFESASETYIPTWDF